MKQNTQDLSVMRDYQRKCADMKQKQVEQQNLNEKLQEVKE